ncbi:hypothetical protein FE633_41185 [Streptomyces montanus]|uniref:Uncharacterized protein n=1 Tax=Streptomyces montanus TaxID=2580423 RepID=A0A5R9FEA0_9ACTN|nr:hypothetical protein [Streptomyces montanus]TLS40506.1 hypothetical protein FE633_41185 [Streptomyces montanus]
MPSEPGEITINSPKSGTLVVTGESLPVAGHTIPGQLIKPNGTFVAEQPPSSVRVRVDDGAERTATRNHPTWKRWETGIQLTSPGTHTITATAWHPQWAVEATTQVTAVARRIGIVGVERTQATQFFNINGQGTSTAQDNSVPLVEGKPLVLRVYVNSASGTPPLTRVSGELVLDGTVLDPSNTARALPGPDISRGASGDSLNFWISPTLCSGTKTCRVRVFDPAHQGVVGFEDETTFTLTFTAVPRPRVHAVLLHYTGLGLDIPAPTDADVADTLSKVVRMYPISGFNYTGFTVHNFAGNLTLATGGGCTQGWNELIGRLWTLRMLSGTTDVYMGLLPHGVPSAGVIGCGLVGAAVGFNGDGITMAQELGHSFDRDHAPCPANITSRDPDYPDYPGLPLGSIGEFGLDIGSFQVHDPALTSDFMSWCEPAWVSPYTYMGLRTTFIGTRAAVQPTLSEGRASMREQLVLSFRLHRDGTVQLFHGFHLPAGEMQPTGGEPSDVTCELRNAKGRTLSSVRCRLGPHSWLDDEDTDFHEVLPWDETAHSLVFRRGQDEVHTHVLERTAPRVTISGLVLSAGDPGTARLEWTAAAPPRTELRHAIRYSNDGGTTWRGIAVDLSGQSYDVDLSTLPAGERCHLQVVTSSGIRTATAQTGPFTVQAKPPHARHRP